MKNAIQYKKTWAAKGSPLALAIAESPAAAKRLYDETTERFDAIYPGAKLDRIAFENWNNSPAPVAAGNTQI